MVQTEGPLYVPYAYGGAKGLTTALQHCPDFNDRFTLTDGKTRAVPYPQTGFNCRADYGLAQGKPAAETRYVPYAYAGAKGLSTDLQHCPDFNDRFTLTDGKTRAVPYPQKGANCRADYGLAQGKPAAETRYVPYAYAGAKGLSTDLQHCPDFNDRFTLTDGKTRAVPYPQKGANCRADYGLAQGEPRYVPYAYAGAKGLTTDLQHCPDFNDRFTLTDGKTRGIPYPEKGFNCRADYGLAQEQGEPRYVPYVYAGAKGLSTDL